MRFFTGTYERTIDEKNRIQIPSQLRAPIDPERDGTALYVVLGEEPGTLCVYTERSFEELGTRVATERMPSNEAKRFELQLYSLASRVELDKQGRLVLPERLVRKAGLKDDVLLVGRKWRMEIWGRQRFEASLGIDWEGDAWPDWSGFLRMSSSPGNGDGH